MCITLSNEPDACNATLVCTKISSNDPHAFTLNSMKLKTLRKSVLKTPCGRLFCDMARAAERETKKCLYFAYAVT